MGEVEDSRALTAHAILQQPLGVDGVARQQALQGHRMRRQRMRLRPVDARFDTPAQRHMPFQQLAQGLFDGVGRGADYAQVGQQVVGGVLRRQLLGHPQAPFGEAQPGGAGARLRLVALGRGLAQQFQQGLGVAGPPANACNGTRRDSRWRSVASRCTARRESPPAA